MQNQETETRKELPDLPGNPMPCYYGTVVLDTMTIPDYMGVPAELMIDAHGQHHLCLKAGEDADKEHWLMVPAHPNKLRRTLNGSTPVLSTLGNADYVLVQDRPENDFNKRTHIVSQRELGDSLPNLPEMTDNIELNLEQLLDWHKMTSNSWNKLSW